MKNIWKIVLFLAVIFLLIFGYIFEENKSNIIKNPKFSKHELLEMEIEDLKEENFKLKEERDDLISRLDYLQDEYEYAEELIELLQNQLISYGIKPDEL